MKVGARTWRRVKLAEHPEARGRLTLIENPFGSGILRRDSNKLRQDGSRNTTQPSSPSQSKARGIPVAEGVGASARDADPRLEGSPVGLREDALLERLMGHAMLRSSRFH
jgi:hypothetical protein